MLLAEAEVRPLDATVLELHHELPAAAPCAAGLPFVLVALSAGIVGESMLAGHSLLDRVDGGRGAARDRLALGVARGEDVEALIAAQAKPYGYGLARLGFVERWKVVHWLVEAVKVKVRRQ